MQTRLRSGMSMDGAASFIIAGPAAKIANPGALKIVSGMKHFSFYILFVSLFAFTSGLAMDLL
ncbi:MAG: hypothetical protein LBG43_03370 [Treponema sp.]|nr:hypothetical protein [Treponema sp.]